MWFATFACSSEYRLTTIEPSSFGTITLAVLESWKDRCANRCCHAVPIRQLPIDFSLDVAMLDFAVYFCSVRAENRPVHVLAIYHEHGKGEVYDRKTCILRWGPPIKQLQAKTIPQHPFLGELRLPYPTEKDESTPVKGAVLIIDAWVQDDDPSERSFSRSRKKAGPVLLPFDQDEMSLMQVWPHLEGVWNDPVSRYIRDCLGNAREGQFLVWMHAADDFGRVAHRYRTVTIQTRLPNAPQVRATWGDVIGRRPCYIFPIKPVPTGNRGAFPQFLLTTIQGDAYAPMLFDYISDQTRFRATFIFRFGNGFPLVGDFFQQAIPTNSCIWANDCSIAVNDVGGPYVYEWGHRVPVFEGMFVTLREFACETDSDASTCVSSDDPSAEDSSDSATSVMTYDSEDYRLRQRLEPEAHHEENAADDEFSMMQLPWELQFGPKPSVKQFAGSIHDLREILQLIAFPLLHHGQVLTF